MNEVFLVSKQAKNARSRSVCGRVLPDSTAFSTTPGAGFFRKETV